MLTRSTGRAYFGAQAVAGAAWWVGVFTAPGVRAATLGGLDPVLVACLDVPLFVVASALAALGVRWATAVAVPWTLLVTLGMVAYATATGSAGWGTLAMLAASAGGTAAALLIHYDRAPVELMLAGPLALRVARPRRRAVNVSRTGVQLAVFWGLFLCVIPAVIALAEARWGLRASPPPGLRIALRAAGAALLAAASALGLWSAFVMSTRGEGTPLPSDAARRLVIAGPYRWVRNPMALAGITQGVAVGLLAGSWLVVLYALCGSLVWNMLVRPVEEADLAARFDAAFTEYREQVPCWVPRLRPWHPDSR